MPPLATVTAAVTAYAPSAPDAVATRSRTLAHLAAHGDLALTRDIPEHLTASALVLDPSLTRALLCFHRKGQFWVQPGGHLDPEDADPRAGALRELAEETGVRRPLRALPDPVDIDRHALSSAFGRCAVHVDLGYAVVADPAEATTVSAESTDVTWWPLDALPDGLADAVADRLAGARRALRAAGVG